MQLITFSFVHVSELNLLEAFAKVNSNAVGLDGLPIRLLLPVVLPFVHNIFNQCNYFHVSITVEKSYSFLFTKVVVHLMSKIFDPLAFWHHYLKCLSMS